MCRSGLLLGLYTKYARRHSSELQPYLWRASVSELTPGYFFATNRHTRTTASSFDRRRSTTGSRGSTAHSEREHNGPADFNLGGCWRHRDDQRWWRWIRGSSGTTTVQ